MTDTSPPVVDRRSPLLADLLVALWIVGWLVAGVILGRNLSDLRQVSDSMESSADSIDQVAGAIGALGDLPLAGSRFDDVAVSLEQTAADVAESAVVTRDSLGELSILLAFSLALLPTVPVLVAYLPWRLAPVLATRRAARAAAARTGPEAH